MKTSEGTISQIKEFEGLRLKAYKAVSTETYYTIGYGHMSPQVGKEDTITLSQADSLLRSDILSVEKTVNKQCKHLDLTQNEFDALVSFTFNCGSGNLANLIKNRTLPQIGEAILKYTHAGGKELPGLVRRRKWEHDLFIRDTSDPIKGKIGKVTASVLNVRLSAGTASPVIRTLKKGAQVHIKETWHRTEYGWISAAYVDI